MSDGGRCEVHDNWHAHCQQCCRERIAERDARIRDEVLEEAAKLLEKQGNFGNFALVATERLVRALKRGGK